ncbi:MAG: hypothetical protein LUG12_11955 [Erysipelotrichaceae bacterium]|nr:hypothetical protein [Erysipelotrichaceae bacterium]
MLTTMILSIIMMISIFVLIWSAVALIQQKKFFATAPKDIQDAIIEREERFKGARLLGYIIGIVCIISFIGAFIYGAYDGIAYSYSLVMFFIRFIIMLYLYKAFDIIFLDWFLLTKTQFYQHYYPETKDCAGFHQFGFNRKEQTIEIIIYPFIALLLAIICNLL